MWAVTNNFFGLHTNWASTGLANTFLRPLKNSDHRLILADLFTILLYSA